MGRGVLGNVTLVDQLGAYYPRAAATVCADGIAKVVGHCRQASGLYFK
jgi:hypothetical protein